MDFDCASFYPSALYDEKPVYLKKETGFDFEAFMSNVYVKEIINQTFNQNGNETPFLKKEYYNPPILIFQHLPAERKNGKVENYRMGDGYIINTLASVHIQEIEKKWRKSV